MSPGKRKIIIYFILTLLGAGALYVIFIGIVCVNVGFSRINQTGFWMPLFVGFLIIYLTVRGFFLVLSLLRSILKDQELLSNEIQS